MIYWVLEKLVQISLTVIIIIISPIIIYEMIRLENSVDNKNESI
jgi:hypothetical protein